MSLLGRDGGLRHYEVLLARSVKERLLGIPSRNDASRIARRLRMLEVAPATGEAYEPIVTGGCGFIARGRLIDITPITLNLSEKCE